LAAEAQAADNRARVAEDATSGIRDLLWEHRNALGEIAQRQGVTNNHIDQRQTHVHNNMADENIRNGVADMMRQNAAQFGAFMQQQNMNSEELFRALCNSVARQQNPSSRSSWSRTNRGLRLRLRAQGALRLPLQLQQRKSRCADQGRLTESVNLPPLDPGHLLRLLLVL